MTPEVSIAAMVILAIAGFAFLGTGLYCVVREQGETRKTDTSSWVAGIIFSGIMCFLCFGAVAKVAGIINFGS